MKRFLAVAACLILVGCDRTNEIASNTLIYVRDSNGIVYAKGFAGGSMFFMTAIPESDVHKIPADQIIDLPKPNR